MNSLRENEQNTFYKRMKSSKKDAINAIITPVIQKKKNAKNLILDEISLNMLQNKQNLNNPEEFYSGFFANIIEKQSAMKTNPNISKSISRKKTVYNKEKTKGFGITSLKRNSTTYFKEKSEVDFE